MKLILSFFIHLYRLSLSPFLGNCCRFYPSCSEYSLKALSKHGALKGCWLTLRRIVKCGPWHPGGYDPIDEEHENSSKR
ncbi:MAG: membrane protein insertion efficiency factor YidD [Anaerolineae bacterium]